MPDSNETKGKKTVGLYVDVAADLKYQLERIAFERSGPGARVALRTIVNEALQEYVARHSASQGSASQGAE